MAVRLERPSRLWERLISSIARRPLLWAGMMLYWLWTNMTFQMPVVLVPVELYGHVVPAQLGVLAANILAYVAMVALFVRKGRETPRHRAYLWVICGSISLGSAFIVVWSALLGSAFSDAQTLGVLDVLGSASYAVGAVLAGCGSAALCIEMQRVYGSIESENILFHGSVSYFMSLAIVFVLSFMPNVVVYFVYVVCPLPIAYCLSHAHGELTKKQLWGRGEGVKFKLPYKLLVTALLHGLSLGLLAGSAVYQTSSGTFLLLAVFCYIVSSVLILITAFMARLSFNSMIYQIAFTMIALGLYALYVFDRVPYVGVALQLVGFSYLHLVMWCVCSFLIKNFDMPSVWVVGTSTCAFMLGQFIGNAASSLTAQSAAAEVLVPRMFVTAMLVMLGAALLMTSNSNLRTGWGLSRPDGTAVPEGSTLDFAIRQLVAMSSLSQREASVLRLLARGRNRQAISEELCISKETAKTHIQSIYRKVGVHSQQELISLLEERCRQSEASKG